jgi:hypothetical protein
MKSQLDLRPLCKVPAGHVGLPALVGQARLEPDPGAPRPLVGLGGDEPALAQHPPDPGHRGHLPVALLRW